MFLGPVDAKVALLNGSVDARATREPYTTQMVKTNEGQITVSGKGLLPGNTFLAATDSALNDPHKRAALQDYLQRGRRRALGLRQSRQLRQNVGDHPLPGGDRPRAVCQPPVAVAAAGRETVAQQQTTADFYLANGLIRTRLDVKPTFDRRFSVPAAEVTP